MPGSMPSALSVILLFNVPPSTPSDPAANEVDLVIVPIFNGTDTEAPRVAADPGTASRVAGSGTLQQEGVTPLHLLFTWEPQGDGKSTQKQDRSGALAVEHTCDETGLPAMVSPELCTLMLSPPSEEPGAEAQGSWEAGNGRCAGLEF